MKTFKTLEDFVFYKRSRGGYTFTLEEAEKSLGSSFNTVKQSLFRLRKKGNIAVLRQGFYLIIPPEYSHQGTLPLNLYVDDLMKWLNKPYYIALYTAASLHGAAHQQPMESFIVTKSPSLRNIKNKKTVINFFVKKSWDAEDIEKKKSSGGYINVSCPELTALDLFTFWNVSGINKVSTILIELVESFNVPRLKKTAARYPNIAAIQRMGYVLDHVVNRQDLAEGLFSVLKKYTLHYTKLSHYHEKKGAFDTHWKIIRNIEIETDI